MAEKTEKPQSETAAKKAGGSAAKTSSAAPKAKAAGAKPKTATAKSTAGAKPKKTAAKSPPKEAKPQKTSEKPKAATAKSPAKAARKDVAKIKIRYFRSAIGRSFRQKRVVQGLGLRKLNQVVERPDTPEIRGMVAKIPHLVQIVQGDKS